MTIEGNATVSGNRSTGFGGGISHGSSGTLTIRGNAQIINNTVENAPIPGVPAVVAGGNGGGISHTGAGPLIIEGNPTIQGNTAAHSGGGVFRAGGGTFTLGGTAAITNNTVGGNPNNVSLADGLFIALGTGGVSAPATGMNVGVNTATASGVFVNSGATAAQAQFFTADAASSVVAWNTGDQLQIVPTANASTITYMANGGTGTMIDSTVVNGANYIIRANGFSRPGFIFTEWNTAAGGSSTVYAVGATITNITANRTLYAQWTAAPTPTAAIANVTIGNAGGNVVITLVNDTFAGTINNTATWITNLPAGMTQLATRNSATQVTVNISGTPTAASTEQIAVTIPAASLVTSSTPLAVTANPLAVFNTMVAVITNTPITFTGVTANGASGTTTTTTLTLNFSANPATLALGDIGISSGVTASTLFGTGNSRTINISGNWINGQQVTVTLTSPAGFDITPLSLPVTLHRAINVNGDGDNDIDSDVNGGGNNGNDNGSGGGGGARRESSGCNAGLGFGALMVFAALFLSQKRRS